LVVAIKRAVGSEYQYSGATYLPQEKQSIKARSKRQISPFLRVTLGIFFVAVVFCGGLSFLYIKAGTAKMNYEISNIKRTNLEIVIKNEKLKLEIEKLKSLDRIEALAVTSLGMIKSTNIEYLVMSDQTKPTANGISPAAPTLAAATKSSTDINQAEAQISSGEKFLQRIEMLVFNKG